MNADPLRLHHIDKSGHIMANLIGNGFATNSREEIQDFYDDWVRGERTNEHVQIGHHLFSSGMTLASGKQKLHRTTKEGLLLFLMERDFDVHAHKELLREWLNQQMKSLLKSSPPKPPTLADMLAKFDADPEPYGEKLDKVLVEYKAIRNDSKFEQ